MPGFEIRSIANGAYSDEDSCENDTGGIETFIEDALKKLVSFFSLECALLCVVPVLFQLPVFSYTGIVESA